MKWLRWRQLAVRRVKRAIECLVYGPFDFFALMASNHQPATSRVAVVHLELLGDALMWLPYGQALVRHLQSQNLQVVVVADALLAPIISVAMPGCAFAFVKRDDFVRSWKIRWHTLQVLRRLGIRQTYQSSYPRDALVQDAVVRALSAPANGFNSFWPDRPWFDRIFSNRLYRRLVKELPHAHQNLRQRAFLEAVGVDPKSVRPADLPDVGTAPCDQPYWVIAPGANRAYRQWPVERFAALAQRLVHERPDWRCVVVGTKAEQPHARIIAAALGDAVLDLAGQTDLPQLLRWIAHARLVLGNDSAAGHIAAAYGTPSVIVAGGGHWGRCYPYDPREAPVRRLPITVGHPMPCFNCDWICEHTTRTDQPYACISAVTEKEVWEQVQAVLAGLPC